MARNYTVSFNIRGSLDGSLLAAIENAQKAMKGLRNSAQAISNAAKLTGLAGQAQSLKAIQSAAAKFRELKLATVETQKALANAQRQAGQFARKTREDAKAVDEARRKLSELKTAQDKLKERRATDRAQLKVLRTTLAEAKKAGDKAQASMIRTAIQNQQAAMKAAAQSYKELASQIKTAKAELKAAEAKSATTGKGFDTSKAEASRLKSSLQMQLEALQRLRSQLGAAGFNTTSFVASERALQAEIERVNQSLQRQQQLLQAQGQFGTSLSNLSNAWSEFQNSISTAQQLMNPFTSAAGNAMAFEKALSRLKSLTQMENIRTGKLQVVEKEMAALTETIERLGATTEYTSNEVVGAANFFAMSGWNEKQIRAALPSTVDLASITQLPIARVADMFSDDLTIMGIRAGEQMKLLDGRIVDAATHFSDQIAFAVSKANLDYSMLHTSLTYNAPAMRLAGLSNGDILAANMIAANAGLKGSVSGTAFRTGIIRIMAPAKKGAQALEELGLSATDAQKEMATATAAMNSVGVGASDTMIEKIAKIKARYDELGALGDKSGQATLLNDIIGKNAFSTWANLLEGANLEQMRQIAGRLDSSEIAGWSRDTAKVMRDNAQTAVDYLTSALDALERTAGTALTPAIKTATEAFTPLVSSTTEFIAKNPALVQATAGIAATMSAATVAVAGFSLSMAGVRLAQDGLKTAKLLCSDIGRAALGAARALRGLTLATVGTGLSSGLTAAATAMKSFGRACLAASRASLAFMITPLGAALTAIALAGFWAYENWDKVAPILGKIATTISGVVSPAIDSALNALNRFGETVGTALAPILPALNDLASFVGGGLAGAFIGLGGIIASVFAGVVVGVAGLVKTIAELGTGISAALEQFRKGNVGGAFEALAKAGAQAAENFKQANVDAAAAIEKGIKATAAALDDLTHMPKLPTQEVTTRHRVEFDETGTARSAPESVSDVQPIDTSALQNSVDTAATTIGQVEPSAAGLATAFASVLPATAGVAFGAQLAAISFQRLNPSTQMAAIQFQAVQNATSMTTAAMMMASPATQALAYSSQNAAVGADMLGASTSGATGGVDALGGAADGASGAVSGLGDAALSAIGALLDAASRAASAAWSSIKGALGFGGGGGSFARGGLVEEPTFFAGEHGREMIIPLTEHRNRAVALWRTAGAMLGILPAAVQRADWRIKRMPRLPSGLKMPQINFPLSTPPTFPQMEPGLEGLRLQLPVPMRSDLPPINLSVTVNISGNADESIVRRGIERAVPALERSLVAQLEDIRREQKRRSFA